MRLSSPAAALLLAVLGTPAAAQRAPLLDEGTLLVSHNGARVGRESFRIQAAENGRYLTATAQAAHGESRLAPALSVDSATGMPVLYRVEFRPGDGTVERLQATGRPGRLSAVAQRAGGESAKEYVLSGSVVVLDADVYHQYALIPLLRLSGRVTVVTPRSGVQRAGSIVDRGSSTIRVDRRDISARHFAVEMPDGRHDVWVDAGGRLLKVAIPGRGIEAVREEAPR